MKKIYWKIVKGLEIICSLFRLIPVRFRFLIKNRGVNKKKFVRHSGSIIDKGVRFILRHPGSIILEKNIRLCRNVKIVIDGGNLKIGEGSTIGENCIFNCFDNIKIGKHLLTADNINFITNTHHYENIDKPICMSGGGHSPITIGDDCWIGINVTILEGTVLGRHCIVGANSVVKGQYPDYCVIVGNPARIIKIYDMKKEKWIRYDK